MSNVKMSQKWTILAVKTLGPHNLGPKKDIDFPLWVAISLPNFSLNRIRPAEAHHVLGPAARHLDEVWDLIWPNPSPYFQRVAVNFFIKISQKCTVWAPWTSRTALWPPPTLGVGVPEWNVPFNLPGVDVVLHAKFEHCRFNGEATYREQTHTPSIYR